MQQEFLFSGFGGQGVMFAGQLLAYAAMEAGFEVTWIPSYGPEMRGGTAHCFTVISSKPIGSPVVRYPSVVVLFNNPSFLRYASEVAPMGLLVYNTSLITERCTRPDITQVGIPATAIAESLGERRLTNVVLLGAALAARPVLSLETLRAALERHLPEHRRDLLAANRAALDCGIDFVKVNVK